MGMLSYLGRFGRPPAPHPTPLNPVDIQRIASVLGVDVLFDPNGNAVPMPKGATPEEYRTFEDRWAALSAQAYASGVNRDIRFRSYDRMDISGAEGAVVLDTYADEALNIMKSDKPGIEIKVSDPEIERQLRELMTTYHLLDAAREDIYTLCKYGDFAYAVLVKDRAHQLDPDTALSEGGATKISRPVTTRDIQLRFLHPKQYNLQGYRGQLFRLMPNDDPGEMDSFDYELLPWEFALFSLASRDTFPYGKSILEKMRLPFEQLVVLEQLMAIARANKIDKIVVKTPALGGDPSSILSKLTHMRATFKSIIMGGTGNSRISRNQDQSLTEYLWAPDGFAIDRLQSNIDISTIDDVEYFRDRLIAASRLPKGYFLADDATDRWGALRQQDIKFARTLLPVQRAYLSGLKRLLMLCAFYLGADLAKLDISIIISSPQMLGADLLQQYQQVLGVITAYVQLRQSTDPSYSLSDEDFKVILTELGIDPHLFNVEGHQQVAPEMPPASPKAPKKGPAPGLPPMPNPVPMASNTPANPPGEAARVTQHGGTLVEACQLW